MTTNPMYRVLQHVRRAALAEEGIGMTDGELLECFIRHHEAAALETLVQRHGAMVWGVCRRTLRNPHDAEDAFQATFLVLVRKAAAIVPREMVGSWLYGVAHQTARKALATAAKRKTRERQVSAMPEPESSEQDQANELQTVLDRELSRMPDKYRAPLLLCELEGKSRKEAARLLGWPEGTVAGRLARGRALLAKQLARHGYTVTGAALAAVLTENAATASVPASVLTSTFKAISVFAAGEAAAGVISSKVAALTKGVLKAMLLTKLKIGVLLLGMGLGMVGLAYGALARGQNTEPAQERRHDPIRGEKENALAAPAPVDRAQREPKRAKENKQQILDGIVQEIDAKHIRLTNGKQALLNEKTEYLRETGDDAAQITRKDVTPGKHVYISVKDTGDTPVALVVVLHLIQPPVEVEKRREDAQADRPGLRSTLSGHLGPVASVAFSPDGRTLAAGSGWRRRYSLEPVGDGEVKLWDLETRTSAALKERDVPFTVFAFSPDGKLIATAREDGTVTLWERDGRRLLATLSAPGDGAIHAVAFSPDGKTLASGGNKVLHLWDVRTRKLTRTFPTGSHPRALAFSPNAKLLAVDGIAPGPVGTNYTIGGAQLWDLDTGKKIAFLSTSNSVLSVAFSPDGKRLATGDSFGYVLLWDVATGKQVFPRFIIRKGAAEIRGHRQAVYAVAFSPDGKLLASASEDKAIKLWQVATGAELATLTGHTNYVQSLAFNPKGDVLASGAADRTVRLWDIPRAWGEEAKPRP